MIQDPKMDAMISDIIEIFTKIEEVELVRLNGLANRERRISGFNDINNYVIQDMLSKMKAAGIINWLYMYECPICHEIFYQIKNVAPDTLKICDTCGSMFIPAHNLTGNVNIIQNLKNLN